MNEKSITVSIHDLNISDKAKGFLARVGLMKLNDLLSFDMGKLSDMRGITDDVYRELSSVIAHADEITAYYIERANRITEILPEVQDTSIMNLGLSTRSYNALRRAGIHTVGSLIQLSQKDIFELRHVGALSREEITKAIENVISFGMTVQTSFNRQPTSDTGNSVVDTQNDPVSPSISASSIDNIPFSVRAHNALKRAGITTVEALIKLTEEEIQSIRNVGQKTREEIVEAINTILEQQNTCPEKYDGDGSASADQKAEERPDPDEILALAFADKGLFPAEDMKRQIAVIRESHPEESEEAFFRLLLGMDEVRKSAKTSILHKLEESDAPVPASALFALFPADIENTTILNQLLEEMEQERTIYLENETVSRRWPSVMDYIAGIEDERSRKIVTDRLGGKTLSEIGEQLGITRERVRQIEGKQFRFLKRDFEKLDERKYAGLFTQYRLSCEGFCRIFNESKAIFNFLSMVCESVSTKPLEQSVEDETLPLWIRERIKDDLHHDYIFLNGSWMKKSGAMHRHIQDVQRYIIHDNSVYLPPRSDTYRMLRAYCSNNSFLLDEYLEALGFKRTMERPSMIADIFESDMEVRESDGTFEEKVFAAYPLIGSKILKPETIEKLNDITRKYIDHVLRESQTKLTLRAEMQIALALINHAKNWKNEDNSNFWNYISLRFGYRDASGAVVRLLQSSLESAMKRNQRLFLEGGNGREFKATVVVHALSTRKSWMALFDFLFDFYKNNLNWRVIPGDPLIRVMIHALGQKLSGDNDEDSELTISSRVYSFQEGIRKLVLYRPVYTRELFERLIGKIDSLVNSEIRPVKTYEEQLCEEWFKEKITAIANTKKTERQSQTVQRDVAIDYSRIRVKYILKNETDVQLVFPDIRLKNEEVRRATLLVSCDGTPVIQKNLSWYGNELGKTLNGVSVSIPFVPHESEGINVQVQIVCDEETIFDSEETMNRSVLLFYGANEITQSQIKRDRYTLIVPAKARVETENADVIDIDALNNDGLKAYFVELKDGYVITVNGRLLAFDSENGTEIRVLAPKESASLPSVTLRDTEAYLAYRTSFCTIILGNGDYLQQFVLLKNGEKIEFSTLRQSDNGLAFTLPFDEEKDSVRLQVICLSDERLLFDRSFVLIDEADCCFNREFYFSEGDFKDAVYYVDIDDFREVVPFSKDDTEIRIPFREGELHTTIPKVEVEETSGAWMQEAQSAWFIGTIPQTSFIKVNAPTKVEISFLVGGEDIRYDGQGLVTIGNALQSFSGTESFTDANIVMNVSSPTQKASYTLARVFFKERFLKRPEFWFEDNKLFWDHGGAFIGNAGRQFSLTLTSPADADYEFKLDEDTDFLSIPDEMPIGNYRYQISIQTGSLFKKVKETIAAGDCIIGDKNLLRFINRRIVVESITDEFNEEAGHIQIRTCYIDQIKFCGVEDTSEGLCPVYSGILYTTGYHGERYEFSFDAHTNKKGITKMMVNPVRMVYISDSSLCITDADGDGLYYYNYYDRNTESIIYALTDHEYTKANENKYSNADLYLYRTERM